MWIKTIMERFDTGCICVPRSPCNSVQFARAVWFNLPQVKDSQRGGDRKLWPSEVPTPPLYLYIANIGLQASLTYWSEPSPA